MLKNTLQCLSIHQIEIMAPIGVYDFEKENKNKFLVSVDVWGDYQAAMDTDKLETTLDYQLIYDIAHEVLNRGGDLIEKSANDIAIEILKIEFPMTKLRVYIEKCNPPLKTSVKSTSFELIWVKLP
jgi:7,8-dihydroneopterin aldolase/epimerase/oxygenase